MSVAEPNPGATAAPPPAERVTTGVRPPSSSAGLARSAGVAGAATMTSRVFGLMRDQVLAYWFGASDAMDAYLVAFRVPNLVRDLFAEGAMSAALVPTFSRTLELEGRDRAWQLGNAVMTTLMLAAAMAAAAAIVFAPQLVHLMAGDFSAVPGKFELTVLLTRIMAPFLILVAMAAACMGMLNSLNIFFIPALAPAMFNIASIVVGIAFVPVAIALGVRPILAMAYGTLVGGLGQVALQWPALRREGFRFRPRFDFTDPGLRRVLTLMGPGIVGLAATQVNVFVNTVVATGEGTGAVSWLTYAFRVMYLPIGLFGVSIATATTPAMSRLAAINDTPRMRSTLASAISLMLTLNVPATFGLVVLAGPIVQLLLQRGHFTPADTVATAAAVQLYALGLVGYSVVKIVSPTFYAMGRSRTPAAVGVAAVLLNAALSVSSSPYLGYKGLALSASIASLFNAGTLTWMARIALGGLELRRVMATFTKTLVASAAMSVAAWAAITGMNALLPGSALWLQVARLAAAIGLAIVTLGLAAQGLRISEFEEMRDAVIVRLRRMLGR
ncbi:MAG: murein biosynthesis integral membrane protein MurJ [Acidobacteriota bacterium]